MNLQIDAAAEPLTVMGDPTRLTQIVGNMLGNAAKYTDAGGRSASARAVEGGLVEIRVRDNGIGIPAAMLPTVFDLFTQARMLDDALTQAAWGSVWRWSSGWSKCTVAASPFTVRARDTARSS